MKSVLKKLGIIGFIGLVASIVLMGTGLMGSGQAVAAPLDLRWTGAQDKVSTISHIVDVINQQKGASLNSTGFNLLEDRDMATSHYSMYVQTAGQLPMDSKSIRIWSDLKTHEV